jgi:DNA invertase Pin-like site-specific DNA recombinase
MREFRPSTRTPTSARSVEEGRMQKAVYRRRRFRRDHRAPALLLCLKTLEPGDTLMVWKLERLGRSLRDLITMLDGLTQRGVEFRSLTPSTPRRRRAEPCGR